MKSLVALIVAVIVLVVLVFFTFAYTVRYDQVAVVTTFGAATQPTYNADGEMTEPGSLRLEPGLYFKWPPPVQRVYAYPKQLQLLDDRKVEMQTADNYSIILSTYVAWRIEDPLKFNTAIKTIQEAERILEPLLRDLNGLISQYRFDQMVNEDPSRVQLDQIEQRATERLREALAEQPWGIAVEHVGIRRLILPEATTEKVFQRMRTTRQRLAQQARSEGEAEATNIRSSADEAREKILAFAESRAQSIRARGDNEAEIYLSEFQKNEQFATFLFQIEALKQMLSNNTTFVLDADDLNVLGLFKGDAFDIDMPEDEASPANE